MEKILDVKWTSQIDSNSSFGKGDCGQAALVMVLEYYGIHTTVDTLSKQLSYPKGFLYTTTQDVNRLANSNGLPSTYKVGSSIEQLKSFIDEGKPVIVLVKYKSLKKIYDKKYDANHFIVIIGYNENGFYYNDSYWSNEADAHEVFISYKDFDNAWKYIYTSHKNERVVIFPLTNPNPAKFKVNNVNESIALMAEKLRYFIEEVQRKIEYGDVPNAIEMNKDNITRAYELENLLKGK